MANYDLLGNIAVVKFPKNTKKKEKLEQARELLLIPSVKTVLEKTDKVKGKLRTIKTKHIAGKKNLVAEYAESGCKFRFKVDSCYFSPRLSNERIEVARMIKKNDRVLVMFSGVGPFSIVIAKLIRPKKVVSIELGKECCKYARENVRLNKVADIVEVIRGDVKKVIKKRGLSVKGNWVPLQFDVIVMPRPNLKETFLREAFLASRKYTKIIYYGFAGESEKEKMLNDILKEAKKLKRKIRILGVDEAGDIAPYEHRYRIRILVEN
jgi:tRNA (guanine37-N1)-methyltransferase